MACHYLHILPFLLIFCQWYLSLCSRGILVYNSFFCNAFLRSWYQGYTALRKQANKYSSSSVFWNICCMVDIIFSFLIKCLVEFTSEVFACGVFLRRAFISGSLSLTNRRPLKCSFSSWVNFGMFVLYGICHFPNWL